MRHAALLAIYLCAMSAPAFAQVTVRKGQGTPAPTQPVTSQPLEEPVFHSDTRNLEAILNKEETARVTREKAKPAKTVPTVTVPANAEALEEEEGMLSQGMTAIRVFAIRWAEAFNILFMLVMFFYVRKFYALSRDQHKILSHAIRSAEYSAAAAKRAADVCEILLKDQQEPDEAQGRLDLR